MMKFSIEPVSHVSPYKRIAIGSEAPAKTLPPEKEEETYWERNTRENREAENARIWHLLVKTAQGTTGMTPEEPEPEAPLEYPSVFKVPDYYTEIAPLPNAFGLPLKGIAPPSPAGQLLTEADIEELRCRFYSPFLPLDKQHEPRR